MIFLLLFTMREFSKFKSRKEWEKFIWGKFLESVKKTDSNKQLGKLLDSVLSENEKRLIIKRIAAISLIRQGKTYKEIGEILWLSPSTISSIKKSLKSGLFYQSRRDIDRKKKNQKRDSKEKAIPPLTIFDYWLNFPLPPMTGRGRWKFLNYQG